MRNLVRLAASLAVIGSLLAVTSPAHADPDDVDTEYGRMMLVLDSSGSMKEPAGGGQTKIAAARAALGDVIDGLPDDADVGLQVFGATVFSRQDKGACTDTQVVVEPGTGNRGGLRAAVDDYKPYGETPIPAALEKAATSLGEEGKRSVVLVSDGESTCGNPCQVAARIANTGVDVQIDVVGLSVSGPARKQLQCIADKGHGSYYDADDSEELSESLQRISDRAVRPFVVQGQPIAGTPSPGDAPDMTAGVWRDSLPGEGKASHYRIPRSIPGSTIWVGAIAQPQKSQQQLALKFRTPGGEDCGSGYDFNSVGGNNAGSLITATAFTDADDEACTETDALTLSIEKTDWSSGDADVPMQIMVFEEPPLKTAGGLPEPAEDSSSLVWESIRPSGDPVDVTPGDTLADAPLLEEGNYRTGGIVPGEAQVYRVHLDWGESLQMRGVMPVNPAAQEAYGALTPAVQLDVLSPTGGPQAAGYDVEDRRGEKLNALDFPPTNADEGTRSIHAKTPPVRYLNREDSGIEHASLPGDYYVVVTQANASSESSVITPVRLEVTKTGNAGEGAPSYVDGAEVEGPVPGGSDSGDVGPNEEESGGEATGNVQAAEDGSGDTLKLVAGIGGIVLGTVAIIAAAWLIRRRA